MVKRIALWVLFLFMVIPLPMASAPENDPIEIVLRDDGMESRPSHRVPSRTLLKCDYFSCYKCVLVILTSPIGEVEVELDNRTTGEHISTAIPSGSNSQMIVCPGTEGYCTITLTLSNGKRYFGEFNL